MSCLEVHNYFNESAQTTLSECQSQHNPNMKFPFPSFYPKNDILIWIYNSINILINNSPISKWSELFS